jgi:hypothetical protein
MTSDTLATPGTLYDRVASYPLLDALLNRRSRRFGAGMRLNGGPLAYRSTMAPRPLVLAEQAALAFAACGITGPALAELPYATGDVPNASSGNIMVHLAGRTVASGDAAHVNMVFVIDDDGAWLLRRPQDFPRSELAKLAQAARDGRLVELYERSRVRIADSRADIPREPPFTLPFNKWSANQPGTTYFLPVAELSAFCINIMLTAFDEEFGYYIVDERNGFKPAGVGQFARSKGGHLYDDPRAGRLGTVGVIETWLCEFAAIEQGGILQNLGLMAEALGLGGFPHFAAHPYGWMQALGFRMENIPFSRTIGAGAAARSLLGLLGKEMPIPTAVGLERDGQALIKPYCPPYYSSMEQAVLAFVDYKYGPNGTLRDGGAAAGWRDGAAVQAGIPRPSDQAIAATIAYCEYVYRRYGRFPSSGGPFRSVLAYQAHHLDPDFYEAFYKPGTYSQGSVTKDEHRT